MNQPTKIIILSILTIMLHSLNAKGQLLENTTWAVFDTFGFLINDFHFGQDTLFYGSHIDPANYSRISTYQENGNNFSIIDLPGQPCPMLGTYTFLIVGDTLKFTTIFDTCSINRSTVLGTYNWLRIMITPTQQINSSLPIEVYPNPVQNRVSIKTDVHYVGELYILYDNLGRKLLSDVISEQLLSLDMSSLPQGIYYLQVGDRNRQLTKILKE